MHKIKNGSSFKKPLHVNDRFGNKIKTEIECRSKLNKNRNGNCIKLNMEVYSRNQYTLTIYLEIK